MAQDAPAGREAPLLPFMRTTLCVMYVIIISGERILELAADGFLAHLREMNVRKHVLDVLIAFEQARKLKPYHSLLACQG